MDWPIVLLCSLATFRLAELLVIDDGPFEMLVNVRGWLQRPLSGNMIAFRIRAFIRDIFSCVHCSGLWIAFIFAALFTNSLRDFVVFGLAVAGLQSIIANRFGRTQ